MVIVEKKGQIFNNEQRQTRYYQPASSPVMTENAFAEFAPHRGDQLMKWQLVS